MVNGQIVYEILLCVCFSLNCKTTFFDLSRSGLLSRFCRKETQLLSYLRIIHNSMPFQFIGGTGRNNP